MAEYKHSNKKINTSKQSYQTLKPFYIVYNGKRLKVRSFEPLFVFVQKAKELKLLT